MRYYSKSQDIRFRLTTPEEEKELFLKARKGDETAREFLITNHLLFAMMQARAMVNGDLPDDEITSAANYAIMLAMQTFEPGRGVRFTTFLRPFIRGQISRLWKSKFSGGVLDPSISSSGSSAVAVMDVPDESLSVEELDLKKFNRAAVAAALAKLPKRNAIIVRQYYTDEWTLERIGKKHRLSRERIRQIIQSSLKKLRRQLSKAGVQP